MFWKKDTKKVDLLEEEIKKSFSAVKEDITSVGKWIKHFDTQNKQASMSILDVKKDLTTIKDELSFLREQLMLVQEQRQEQQVIKKLPVYHEQTDVEVVQKAVQMPVQTDNIYDILKKLSGNERLVVFTLLNSEMKLSYEDIALLLGKERSTIRGQINAIRQKSDGLLEEITEKSGKKRVYIPAEIKEKLSKYAKVRIEGKRRKN